MSIWNIFRRNKPTAQPQTEPTGNQQRLIIWKRGHTTHLIDRDSEEAVREAQRIFDDARRQGLAAIRTAPGPAEVITQYDPKAETIEFIQPIAGG